MGKVKFDLEDRTMAFAKKCADLCMKLEYNSINKEYCKQLIRSSSSVGANYREANDTTTKRNFGHRIGICRREAKESKYWIELLLYTNDALSKEILPLIDGSQQLARIFSAISNKVR